MKMMETLTSSIVFAIAGLMASCEFSESAHEAAKNSSWLDGLYYGLRHPKGSKVVSMNFEKDGDVLIYKRSDVIDDSRISGSFHKGSYTLSGGQVHVRYQVDYKDGSQIEFEDVWDRKFDSGLEFLVLPRLNPTYDNSEKINKYGIVVKEEEMDTDEFVTVLR